MPAIDPSTLSDEARLLRRMQELIAKIIMDTASDHDRTELAELQEMQARQRRTNISDEINARRYA